jgi:mono/diheme cytochrome c family protein
MSTVDSKSPSHSTGSTFGLNVGLFVVIILIAAGAALGIVQMQRGVDQLYKLPKPAELVDARFPEATAAQLPPIIVVGNPAHGRELFNMSCYVCHGPTGAGVPALGANLRLSKFIRTRTDQQLITFIKTGRQPGDPFTVFNGTMPPKGGNPMLDDAGLQDVVAYIRTLQQSAQAVTSNIGSVSSASTLR